MRPLYLLRATALQRNDARWMTRGKITMTALFGPRFGAERLRKRAKVRKSVTPVSSRALDLVILRLKPQGKRPVAPDHERQVPAVPPKSLK
jgi:hypothetical protein